MRLAGHVDAQALEPGQEEPGGRSGTDLIVSWDTDHLPQRHMRIKISYAGGTLSGERSSLQEFIMDGISISLL